MPTAEQLQAGGLYKAIMEEIKLRIDAINSGITGQLPLIPPFVREFSYLQIRMVCELVALGCLVAHGDIQATKTKKLQKEWSAEKIIEQLETLHPYFFPQPVHQSVDGNHHHLQGISPPSLTKDEFLRLYNECGDVLHRGSAKKLLGNTSVQVDYNSITALAQKLNDLLQIHIVVMLGGKTMFVCALRIADDNNNVQVVVAEWKPPQDFEQNDLPQERAAKK